MRKLEIREGTKILRLDFFPQQGEIQTRTELRTELIAVEDEMSFLVPPRYLHSYVQCDCACK